MTQLTPYHPRDYPVPTSPPGFYPPQQAYLPAPAPAPAPRRRGRRRWVFAGLVLALVLGGAGFLALSDAGVRHATDGLAQLDANRRGLHAVPGRMHTEVRDGAFVFVVERLRCGATAVGGKSASRRAQGRFCFVDVTVKNVETEGRLFDGSAQKAYDATGAEYEFDGGAARYVAGQNRVLLENINPGNQARGTLVFDVPTKTRLTSVVLHEATFTPGVRVPLSCGPDRCESE